jgi:hypothetical protein
MFRHRNCGGAIIAILHIEADAIGEFAREADGELRVDLTEELDELNYQEFSRYRCDRCYARWDEEVVDEDDIPPEWELVDHE